MPAGALQTEVITTRTAREWYAEHRVDILAHLADRTPRAALARRSAELLALALDDDPAIVARALTLS
ncbi:MAG TPA: hypothetical protein VIH82_05005 [Acidimicrobiia bacterium]|jgi:hypothetical protein